MATDANNVVNKGVYFGDNIFKDIKRTKNEISNTALVVVKGTDFRMYDELSLHLSSTATSTATVVCQVYYSNADAPSPRSVTSDWSGGGSDIRFAGGSEKAAFGTSDWKWFLLTAKHWRSAGTATTATGAVTAKVLFKSD